MVAALFTDAEIADLLSVKKYMEHEASAKRAPDREGECSINKLWAEEYRNVVFFLQKDIQHPDCHFTLSVQMNDGRPQSAICRYDIQRGGHPNPDGTFFPPMQPHKHIYAADVFRQFGVWDVLAQALQLKKNSCEELFSQFLTDLNIHYSDSESQLMDFMNTRPT